jgi:cell division septation protein DedD
MINRPDDHLIRLMIPSSDHQSKDATLSPGMSEEGFHEIQLNGKQLVFLFMAATVVSVVIFLCGVMVGRGVRVQQGVLAAAADVVTDPTAPAPIDVPPAPTTTPPTDGAPLTTQETLTYTSRLEDAEPPVETLTETLPPLPAPGPAPAPVTPARADTLTASDVPGEPAGPGFVVQVAAVRERDEADIIARRLSGKGYPAFVTTPAGVVKVFRVRVGKYRDRREAESIAAKLEREEQFKPWITR